MRVVVKRAWPLLPGLQRADFESPARGRARSDARSGGEDRESQDSSFHDYRASVPRADNCRRSRGRERVKPRHARRLAAQNGRARVLRAVASSLRSRRRLATRAELRLETAAQPRLPRRCAAARRATPTPRVRHKPEGQRLCNNRRDRMQGSPRLCVTIGEIPHIQYYDRRDYAEIVAPPRSAHPL